MPYEVQKRSTRKGWRVVWNTYAGSTRTQRVVGPVEALAAGFTQSMTIDQAKDWARSVNSSADEVRRAGARSRIQERLSVEEGAALVKLPAALVAEFESERFLQEGKAASYWRAAKRAIVAVPVPLEGLFRQVDVLYAYFIKKEFSPSYVIKVIALINTWGEFLAWKTGKPFSPIKVPKGRHREKIADAYIDSGKADKESAPLTPELLAKARGSLTVGAYNWLYVSLWLGLRPREVDKLPLGARAWYLTQHAGVEVTAVFQWKLTGVPRPKRWKFVPILHKEQRLAIKLIEEGNLKRPLVKTVRRHVAQDVTCYGGRKGFAPLMIGLGHSPFAVSRWLGHKSISTTDRHYIPDDVVYLDAPSKKRE